MSEETIKPNLNIRADLFRNDLKGDAAMIAAFDEAVERHEGDWKAVFDDLDSHAAFDEHTIKNLRFTDQIAEWTGDNTDLVAHLQDDEKINSFRAIARNFDREQFVELVKDEMVPDGEDNTGYKNGLFNSLFEKEPSAMVVNMIRNPQVPLLNGESGKFVGDLLSKNPRFNIKTDSVNILLNDKKNFKGLDEARRDEVVLELKTLQRIASISSVPEIVPALINKNYKAAHQITELPLDQFIAQMGDQGLPTEDLHYTYANAENKKIFYEHALAQIKEAGAGTGIAFIDNGYVSGGVAPVATGGGIATVGTGGGIATVGGGNISGAAAKTLADNNLSWELLFGEGSHCECGECTSVYGPAAYFVDLLQYLRNNNIDKSKVRTNPTDISNTPLDALFKRRSDLGDLELSCENTNTILPYVDLVNEVLEQYVTNGRTAAFNVADETTAELLAAPQHTNSTAYEALIDAVYPFDLPYDRPRDAARIYLKFLDATKYELMTTFPSSRITGRRSRVLEPSKRGGRISNAPVTYDRTDFERSELDRLHATSVERAADAEFLQMSPEEYAIITRESFVSREYWDTQQFVGGSHGIHTDAEYRAKIGLPETANSYFGYSTVDEMLSKDESVKAGLPFVGAQFLPRTGLNIDELIELLKMRFINPPRTGGIGVVGGEITLTNSCLLEEMRLSLGVRDFGNSQCDKIHRFIRLWRRTGWSMRELDDCIASLGNGDITAALLHRIVAIKKIESLTGLEVSKLLCFWGDISTHGAASLYARLFLALGLKPANDIFKADASGKYLVAPYRKIPDHEPVVMAALNLSSNDIRLVQGHGRLSDELSLPNLSTLYRYRLLSKALGMRVPELINAIKLCGKGFEDPESTLTFLERWSVIEQSGFSSIQLGYVINNNNSLAPTETDIIQLTAKLFDALAAIRETHKNIVNNSEASPDFLRGKLAVWFREEEDIDRIGELLNGNLVSKGTAPAGLDIEIPGRSTLSPKLSYDKTSGNLQITGILSQDETTECYGLVDAADPLYSDWKNAVYNLSDSATAQADKAFDLLPQGIFSDVAGARVRLLNPEADPDAAEKKRVYFIQAFLPFLRKTLSTNFIVQTLAEVVSLDLETTKLLAGQIIAITDNNVTRSAVEAIESLAQDGYAEYPVKPVLNVLRRLTLLIKTFELSTKEIKYFHDHRRDFDMLDLNALSFEHWLRLVFYVRLRNSLAAPKTAVIDFWESIGSSSRVDASILTKRLAKLFGVPDARITKLIATEHFNLDAAKLKTEKNLVRLKKSLELAEKIGLDLDLLFECSLPYPTFAASETTAGNLRNAIRSKYNATDWNQVVQPLSDELRNNGRNALVSYILQQGALKQAGVRDADGLFEYFLIDVQMGACMKTSRIKQAISSVQLFIQRCMLGLEAKNGIAPDVLDRPRWEWMQRYRIWEANRKVFLYPENWIETNLRDDKSPFFKEMESDLLQKDINKENVEDALKAYLYKVDEVSNMEVVGLYIEGTRTNNSWSAGSKLHVFSRTRNAPYFFYYRYFDLNEMNWYPWEKIQLDIPSYDAEDVVRVIKVGTTYNLNPNYKLLKGNGCYLSPTVFNGRLFIFFPQFVRKTKPNDDASGKSIRDMAEDSVDSAKPIEYWEIKMAWSERRNGTWTQKQLSKDALIDMPPMTPFERDFDLAANMMAKKESAQRDYDAKYRAAWRRRTKWDQKRKEAEAQKALNEGPGHGSDAEWEAWEALVAEQAKLWDIYKTAWDKEIEAKETLDDITVERQTAIAALQGTPPQPSSDISNYEFVPLKLTGVDSELRLEVYYNQREVGAFGFDGSNLTAKLPNGSRQNSSDVDYFHHSSHTIKSLQKPVPANTSNLFGNPHFFNDDSLTTYNTTTNFHHKDAKKLLGIINSGQMDSLFGYPNRAGNIPDKNDVFGGNGLTVGNNTYFINYNELKRPYSIYNWELFFHCPAMLADAQSKAQRFEEAMNWFHFVFNPLATGTDAKRFWQFTPFREIDSKDILDRIFSGLQPNTWNQAISEWRDNPFKPHLVARGRPVAYMKWVVMKYIDNILDWGDYLFRQDTIESINQATQLYVLGLHILGRRPETVSGRGKAKTQTYKSLLAKWDAFSNAKSEFEVAIPFTGHTGGPIGVPVTNAFETLYFCIPNNPQLLAYWDQLADRLFKIRHCQNIEGVFRELPLFEPPIDPALLVQAAAQGVSLGSVLNDLNTPMPNYRFYYLLQKALELCNELKSMGSAMLSAIEKKDNETISLLRATHESTMNNLVMALKKQQLEEANKALEGLQQNRKSPEHRMNYYLQLIGESGDKIPGPDSDFAELGNAIEKPVDESGLKLIKYEKEDMDKANLSADLQFLSGAPEVLAGILYAIPLLAGDVKPFGLGAGASFGGTNLGQLTQTVSKALQISATHLSHQSARAGKKGGFLRSLQDRIMQANAAGHEIKQIDKQIVSQKIRIQMANQEIVNQQKQIDNAAEVEEFLRSKYTDEELYTWMRDSLKTLYRQVYNLAYDLAKKAEKTYAFERGVSNPAFIRAGYFDAGRDGLLAGEQLYVGLKQLEGAYHETRGYDYEMTRHISLAQLDPLALVVLRQTGKCEFEIPEVLFDLDFPGHYFRRIKSVSLSIPCIAGPYIGVNATLGLAANKLRTSPIASGNYAEKAGETDDRFIGYNVPIKSIATSSAQNDSGVFELNFKDERYLPFEGAGAISRWSLELAEVRQFDWNTISDVIVHMKYTAKEGGAQLRSAAANALSIQLAAIEQELGKTGLHVAINLKHDMPNEWNLLKARGTVDLTLDKSRAPFYSQSLIRNISEVIFFVKPKTGTPLLSAADTSVTLSNDAELGLFRGTSGDIALDTSFKLSSTAAEDIGELIMVVKFGL